MLEITAFVWPLAAISHGRPSLRGAADFSVGNGFGVYLNGWTKTPVPRKILDEAPAEMFYKIPLSSNPAVVANRDGFAFIPKLVPLKVSYVRNVSSIGAFEYGVANWLWNANPLTVFSDKVIAGTAEKMLTLSHKGFWRTSSKDDALMNWKKQGPLARGIASKTGWYRSFLVNAFTVLANPGVQLRDAGLTEDTYKDLQNYARKDDAKPSESMLEKMDVWRESLAAQAAEAGASSAISDAEQTAVNCFHVEGTTGAYWSPEGLYLPLGKKIPVYRGQIAQGPLRTFNVASGIAVVEHNEESQSLEIYFYANNYLNVFDPAIQSVPPPTLYTSALPGEPIDTIVPDTRRNSVMRAPNPAMAALFAQYMAMPVDYEYLFRDPAELCPDEQRHEWGDMFRALDYGKFVHGHGQPPSTLEAANMVRQMTNTIDCATSYLQARVQHSNAYDLMEAIGWGHYIMETPTNDTMKVVTYEHWNDFDIFEPPLTPTDVVPT